VLGTQDESIEGAGEIVRRDGGELHIHGQDCQIRDEHTIPGD
jgi:hypothetical protein